MTDLTVDSTAREMVAAIHGQTISARELLDLHLARIGERNRELKAIVSLDDLIVERIRAAGAVTIGKTNVPEFAAGSHTFNPVFGTTLNPVDRKRSAGGSSGGAACALATGMVPLAEGSDMGGSLRNPASFCGVVGLRPSLGRVPEWPLYNQWETLSVGGPMARNVG